MMGELTWQQEKGWKPAEQREKEKEQAMREEPLPPGPARG